MIALELTDIRGFMNTLLRTEVFDNFLLSEAVIVNGATISIDGHINSSFYTSEELETLQLTDCPALPFSLLRNNCFDLIKGKKTPASFRFVFQLSPKNLKSTVSSTGCSYTPADISGIFINIKYQNQLLTLTTGISYNIFSTDRSLDMAWDKMVKIFLKKHQIEFEDL